MAFGVQGAMFFFVRQDFRILKKYLPKALALSPFFRTFAIRERECAVKNNNKTNKNAMDGEHRMNRRSNIHHYCWPGTYHVTIKVNEALHQPLGTMAGDVSKTDGHPDAPHVQLTAIGSMVEEELTTSITAHYPMIEVHEHVVMADHLHAIVVVRRDIVSASGRPTHLGQVIAGFKKGCNRRFWEMTEQKGEPFATRPNPSSPPVAPSPPVVSASSVCLAVHPQAKRTPSSGTTGRTPLFSYGYVDVMPIDERQQEQQRQYIHNNPRSRLLRTSNRNWLQPQRLSVPTALTLPALMGYLQRECPPRQLTPETRLLLQSRLQIVDGQICCDSYGNKALLQQRLLPVVCHRRDTALFQLQRQRCLEAAQQGAVLVSARIAEGEQAIMDEAISHSLPVVLVADNGFPELYHPSSHRIHLCAEGRLLIVTPWLYNYRPKKESISVAYCKTMNCVVQSLCRLKNSWWK